MSTAKHSPTRTNSGTGTGTGSGTGTRSRDRSALSHRLRYAARHPRRIVPFLRRTARDLRLRRRAGRDHIAYYRAVMKSDTARNPRGAVGTPTEERWNALGKMQFDYLLAHGMSPSDRLLDIGCGNLRAGHHLIRYLEPGHYHGLDISPDILLAAQHTVTEQGLQARLPYLTLVEDLRLAHLPAGHFRIVHAHSVFSHSPIEIIDECFAHVARVLAPGGYFDFTYNRTDGAEHHVLHEDFYYRPATLLALAAAHGLEARIMEDWDELPHQQSKIRVRASAPGDGSGRRATATGTSAGTGAEAGTGAGAETEAETGA